MKYLFLTYIIISTLYRTLSAQSISNDIPFTHLTTANGLSQNSVNCIYQDSYGFIWIGTDFSLNRWDGNKIKNYEHNLFGKPSIGQGESNCIYEDQNKDLWIGTGGGAISRYNRESDSFTNFSSSNNPTQIHTSINQIIDINGNKIMKAINGKIYLFTANDTTHELIPVTITNNSKASCYVNTMYYDSIKSTLWLGCTEGVFKASKININTTDPVVSGNFIYSDNPVSSIIKFSEDKLFFGTTTQGLFEYNCKKDTTTLFYNPNRYNIISLSIDYSNNLWFGTEGNGVFIWDSNNNKIHHIQSRPNNTNALSSDIIRYIYADNNRGVWIGTHKGGVNYYDEGSSFIHHYKSYGEKGGLRNNSILSICKLSNNKLMLGTDRGGIGVFDKKTKSYTELNILKQDNTDNKIAVIDIKNDNKGNIYIATYKNGLYIYNEYSGKTKNYRKAPPPHKLKTNDIWTIQITHDSALIGTLDGSIYSFKKETETFTKVIARKPIPHIKKIITDHNGNIWAGTFGQGILMISKKQISFRHFHTLNSGLLSNKISCIYEDSNNNIWVGTFNNGISILFNDSNNFVSYTKKDGLYDNSIKSIIEDTKGNIWASGNECIMKINLHKDSLITKHLTATSDISGNTFNANAVATGNDNTIYFGGSNGLYYFKPSNITFSNKTGKLVISDISLLYDDRNTPVLTTPYNKENTIYVKHNISVIDIEYSLCDFSNPRLNTFYYKLEGFDNRWIYAGNNHKATYTNLLPGNYTFMLKGANSLGNDTPFPIHFNLVITPPFWDTLWFKVLIAISSILLLWLIYYIRLKIYAHREAALKKDVEKSTKDLAKLNDRLSEQNEEINMQKEELLTTNEQLANLNRNLEEQEVILEDLVNKRTKELIAAKTKAEESEKLKMAFLANMSHEIRTPANAIIGFTNIIASQPLNKDKKQKFTKIINSNSNDLLVLIDDILTLSRIESSQSIITKTEFNIIITFEEIASHWLSYTQNDSFNKNVKFKYINHIKQEQIIIKSNDTRTKQIINNLIDNALKFTKEGSVTLITKKENNYITAEIKDTGVGIDKDNISRIFERFKKLDNKKNKDINAFKGAGLGLTIVKKLIDILGYEISVKSTPDKGSSFIVKIPTGKQ